MNAMTDTAPYSVPPEPGRWRAITLAALMHLFLLLFFWIGIRWTNETPATIEAEVWSPQPREAAPAPIPVPAPEPEKQPEPKPVLREQPKPVVEEKPIVKPDIALEQEKKRKAEEKKRLEEEQQQQAKLKKQREKEEAEKLAKAKAAEEERQKKEKLEKEKKLAEAKRKQQEAEEKLLAKIRDEDMKRLAGGVTGTGGTGTAAKSQGGRASADYANRIAAKIKSNITFNVPEGLADNPPVEFIVDLLPDGSVAGIRKTRSSGVPGFDEAVRRAIEKSQPFPKDKNGAVPSSFVGSHRPKDQ